MRYEFKVLVTSPAPTPGWEEELKAELDGFGEEGFHVVAFIAPNALVLEREIWQQRDNAGTVEREKPMVEIQQLHA